MGERGVVMSFYGRQDELSQLADLWLHPQASLVTCRGRRRIGKSTLIRNFAEISQARFLHIEGLAPNSGMDNATQLTSFGRQLAEQMGMPPLKPDNWYDAFHFLASAVHAGERTVILLDEISWMGHYDKDFAGELKYAWDNRFHGLSELVLVLCGSVSSWIDESILSSTGFVGRISLDLIVRELPLPQCVSFWGGTASRLSSSELLDMLSITGGVPRYLEEIIPSQSTEENIRRMCFRSNGYLFRDFDDVFSSVFSDGAALKKTIMTALANGSLTGQELATAVDIPRNGRLSAALQELELAGFVSRSTGLNPLNGRPTRVDMYRLRDNYSRFYLKYIMPHRHLIEGGVNPFQSLEGLPGWDAILGLQFENLVLNNVVSLIPKLHLAGVQILSAAPYRRKSSTAGHGLQIDLLIQMRKSMCIVEIKHKNEIGHEVEDEVAEKLKRLNAPRDLNLRTALVYCGHLAKTVQNSGFFDAIVPFEALLEE